ncbi:hypothetical protein ACOSQ2_030990 [Xanthoceras sorbifolium]
MTFSEAKLALLVAMASAYFTEGVTVELSEIRKYRTVQHWEELALSTTPPGLIKLKLQSTVFLGNVAGGKTQITPASLFTDHWIQASKELGIQILYDGMSIPITFGGSISSISKFIRTHNRTGS